MVDLPLELGLVALAIGFAWSIGAHYTGACMGMPFAAGAISAKRALLLMAPLALLGAVLASGRVETTVGTGILEGGAVSLGVAAIVVACAFALTTAYNFVALPTSTIQLFTFSVVGVGLAEGLAVRWTTIELLLAVWAVAPFVAFALGFLLVRVLDRTPLAGAAAAAWTRRAAIGLVLVGAVASFAMGANDVSNASGPLVMTGLFGLTAAGLLGGLGLALGVLTWGQPLLRRVAFDVVHLDPAMATGAQLSQGAVILTAVAFGTFTSMNQALIGGMIGAGLARGRRVVAWPAVRGIVLGWAVGPVSGALLGFSVAAAIVRLPGL
jgi:inorganic phosphate transporter, PiT family